MTKVCIVIILKSDQFIHYIFKTKFVVFHLFESVISSPPASTVTNFFMEKLCRHLHSSVIQQRLGGGS